jgi:hypothetical protein
MKGAEFSFATMAALILVVLTLFAAILIFGGEVDPLREAISGIGTSIKNKEAAVDTAISNVFSAT